MTQITAVTFGRFQSPWHEQSLYTTEQIPSEWKSWLIDHSSLTVRLNRHCGSDIRVKVLKQGYDIPDSSERSLLEIGSRDKALIREVCLSCGEIPLVIARTVIPHKTLTGKGTQLKYLGNRPLGHFLFSDPTLKRSPIEISNCELNLSQEKTSDLTVKAWGRRSQFIFYGKPLLVSEFLLPDLVK